MMIKTKTPKQLEHSYRGRRIYWQAIGSMGGWKIHGVEMLPMRSIRECREMIDQMLDAPAPKWGEHGPECWDRRKQCRCLINPKLRGYE